MFESKNPDKINMKWCMVLSCSWELGLSASNERFGVMETACSLGKAEDKYVQVCMCLKFPINP